jgi:hypothetical protein
VAAAWALLSSYDRATDSGARGDGAGGGGALLGHLHRCGWVDVARAGNQDGVSQVVEFQLHDTHKPAAGCGRTLRSAVPKSVIMNAKAQD